MNKQIKIILALIILILIALSLFITAVAPIMGTTPALKEAFTIVKFFISAVLTIVIVVTAALIIFGNKEKNDYSN